MLHRSSLQNLILNLKMKGIGLLDTAATKEERRTDHFRDINY